MGTQLQSGIKLSQCIIQISKKRKVRGNIPLWLPSWWSERWRLPWLLDSKNSHGSNKTAAEREGERTPISGSEGTARSEATTKPSDPRNDRGSGEIYRREGEGERGRRERERESEETKRVGIYNLPQLCWNLKGTDFSNWMANGKFNVMIINHEAVIKYINKHIRICKLKVERTIIKKL